MTITDRRIPIGPRLHRSPPADRGPISQYYELVTDFFEYGWGQAFHFAPRYAGETTRESLLRHEYQLVHELGLRPGDHVFDVGCGVGGPMRNIARFAGVDVTGITISAYQVDRARALNASAGLESRCHLIHGDFTDIPCAAASFDAAFAIEATCHAADRRTVFAEVLRVLRPGALFGGYEWCLTDRYVPGDPEHERVRAAIDKEHALTIAATGEIDASLRDVGFELLDARDVVDRGDPAMPWYLPLTSRERGIKGLRASTVGRKVTAGMVAAMEAARLAPTGAREVTAQLEGGARALVRGGELGIFTPHYRFLARAPS